MQLSSDADYFLSFPTIPSQQMLDPWLNMGWPLRKECLTQGM